MEDHLQQAQRWLDHEDLQCRQGRVERFVWPASVPPAAEFLIGLDWDCKCLSLKHSVESRSTSLT